MQNNNQLSVIKLKNISKSFQIDSENVTTIKNIFTNKFLKKHSKEKLLVLNNISFEVYKGEFVGIIGKNGAGKSTLLKIIAGVYAPDSGKLEINGSIVPFLELGVGFNPELTAKENIYLNGTILGLTKKQITKKFDSIVKFAELERFVEVPLKKFSSGMQVRLAFSIAMEAEGDIYIMDEVLAVGDATFQSKCIQKLQTLINNGKTILFVSHNEQAINEYCNRVIYLSNSEVKDIGKAEVISKEYKNDINS